MQVIDHLRLLKNPGKADFRVFAKIEQVVQQQISTNAVADAFLGEILRVFHEALTVDTIGFIKDIFYPNQLALRATYARERFILTAFRRARRVKRLEQKQIALENVYRSIVADLFDPYLAILVAAMKLKDGDFKSFELANLEQDEINKYQFVLKRLKHKDLLKGYSSTIRNAISHTGSNGIFRDQDHITFNNIKRRGSPHISDSKTVTTSELEVLIQELIDFVVAMEAAVNILGLDIQDIIVQKPELARAFQALATREQLTKRRKKTDAVYSKVWDDTNLTLEEKRAHFARLFAEVCRKNEVPAISLQFKDQFAIVRIPHQPLAGPGNQHLVNRVAEMINYLLLAEIFFHFAYSDYLVEEADEPDQVSLQFWSTAVDLRTYSLGASHMSDLIHDGKFYRNREFQMIRVDFEKLDEMARRSFKFERKRKQR